MFANILAIAALHEEVFRGGIGKQTNCCESQGTQSRARRDELVAIQVEAQRIWAEEKIFEVDAPPAGQLQSV